MLRIIIRFVETFAWWVLIVAFKAKASNIAPRVAIILNDRSAKVIAKRGIKAPTKKDRKELIAAWIGIKRSVYLRVWGWFSIVLSWISRWALTEIHSPPAIEQAPEIVPIRPLINNALLLRFAPVAPRTIPEIEMMPSLAPKMLARMILMLSQKRCVLILKTLTMFMPQYSNRFTRFKIP